MSQVDSVPVELHPAENAVPPSEGYAWYVVGVLILAYTVSFIDRTILSLMVKPIKASLHISDVQISLLHGFAFAIFYTVLGIPIARLADRRRRVTIISCGVFVWSLMTGLCGVARNFGQLFLCRVGVGVGEGALSPPAYSLLADYFPAHKLSRALSVYTGATYVGAGLALIGGGALIALAPPLELPGIGHLAAWQTVFLIVGLPGLLVAALTSTLREPPRKGMGVAADAFPSVKDVAAYVWRRRGAYGLTILGFSASSLIWNGTQAWIATFFIRRFGWSAATVGLRYGFVLLLLGTGGIFLGGVISDWLRSKGRTDSNLLIGVISALITLPFGVAAPLMGNGGAALAVYAVFTLTASMPYGAAAAAFQEITPNRMRAQVSALYFFGLNMAGIGVGPTVVALLTDRVFKNEAAVGASLSWTALFAFPLSAGLLWAAARAYRKLFAEMHPAA